MEFTFPVWVPCKPGTFKVTDLAVVIGADLSRCIPIFCSEESGNAFIEGNAGGSTLRQVQSPLEFFGLLVLLQETGVANVVIDHEPSPNGASPSKTDAIPVPELRAALGAVFL
jgi:hypothetical protein